MESPSEIGTMNIKRTLKKFATYNKRPLLLSQTVSSYHKHFLNVVKKKCCVIEMRTVSFEDRGRFYYLPSATPNLPSEALTRAGLSTF